MQSKSLIGVLKVKGAEAAERRAADPFRHRAAFCRASISVVTERRRCRRSPLLGQILERAAAFRLIPIDSG